MPCVIRYAILPAVEIVNLCGPECDPFGWTPELIEARKKKTNERLQRGRTKTFFKKLEESILDEGYRNPILVTAGLFSKNYKEIDPKLNFTQFMKRVPPEQIHNAEKLLTCERLGGSRLWIGQKHNLKIPCVINDFVEGLPEAEVLNTCDDILDKFTDHPSSLLIDDKGVMAGGMPHIHMK